MTTPTPTPLPAAARRLDDVRLTDAPEVGGKAASLGELISRGVRVPPGVVFTIGSAELTEEDRSSVVRDSVAAMGDGPFAVRSSGVFEDGMDRSFAGMYESVLDVATDALPEAVDRVLASARAERVTGYEPVPSPRMAVIVQRMVEPASAGVALTADPVSGDRGTTVVTAVRGTGERLVSGAAVGDEWAVEPGRTSARRRPERAIDRGQAEAIAAEARRIADARGVPQDVEWALDRTGALWIVQARPMTALPPAVPWAAPAKGAYSRSLRFGEWIGQPVTPLFESWLLSILEVRLHARIKAELGQRAPLPHHVIVNGWYFYSLNWISPSNMLRSAPSILLHALRNPRLLAGILPPTARHAVPPLERAWREEIQPRYRSTVADAEARVEEEPLEELPEFIDQLAGEAGEYFMWVVALAGAAYKLEMTLARFYQKHVAPTLGGSHLPLLTGIEAPTARSPYALSSLDWWDRPVPTPDPPAAADHVHLVAQREAMEQAAFAALAASPRRLRTFRRLLTEAQHVVPIREEQVAEWTLPWPILRRAVERIGHALAEQGQISDEDDVFFLTRDEALAALVRRSPPPVDVASRRAQRVEQSRLVPPLVVGRMNRGLRAVWASYARMLGASRSEHAIVSGVPASAGRVTGAVRIVRGPDEFDQLNAGEILVAPVTAPAWTPLFKRAAAVVTDVGSPAAHASIIAREYGIPAVVGCGDATARLRTGMLVTVDGATGNVEPA